MAKNDDFYAFMDFTKRSLGLEDSIADRYAQEVSRNFGGEYLYITNQMDRILRDKQIRQNYNGSNMPELAEQYRLSRRQIFNIINGRQNY